jgi:hypothetical protein
LKFASFLTSGASWSALYGNRKEDFGGGAGNIYRDYLVQIVELNIGPQYRRRLSSGAYLTLGGGLEAQYYSNGGPFSDTQDAGLAGFSTTVAITR